MTFLQPALIKAKTQNFSEEITEIWERGGLGLEGGRGSEINLHFLIRGYREMKLSNLKNCC